MIDLDLTGKRAVVTGASLGIGAAVVTTLADHGADVVFCARSQGSVDELAAYKSDSGSVAGIVADMGNAQSTKSFLEQIDELGGCDVLVEIKDVQILGVTLLEVEVVLLLLEKTLQTVVNQVEEVLHEHLQLLVLQY